MYSPIVIAKLSVIRLEIPKITIICIFKLLPIEANIRDILVKDPLRPPYVALFKYSPPLYK